MHILLGYSKRSLWGKNERALKKLREETLKS